MIKILNALQIKDADKHTIQNEPISSIDLMERAANAFVLQFHADYSEIDYPIHIFCGNGNNGGDGLAIARLLLHQKKEVTVYVFHAKKYAVDFSNNLIRLQKKNKKCIHYINDVSFIDNILSNSFIIDSIFGTGLNATINEDSLQYKIIEKINSRHFYQVIAVDIPSGLFADQSTNSICIEANKTYTFQFPKLSFLLPESGKYVNDFTVLDINLHPDIINKSHTLFYYITKKDIADKIKYRKKYSHKGTYGHALIIAGSYGKMGAAVLTSKACLRSGCGLVTVHIPKCGYEIMQTFFPEAMCSIDKNAKYFSKNSEDGKYDTVAIGPGIGTHPTTIKAFENLLAQVKTPIIMDADALNILSKKKELQKLVPKNSILTPHPKEFERLVGAWTNDFERLTLQQNFSKKNKVIVILKGANTSISDINGCVYFNSTGNAGMATAGTGDVLTGIITSLLAQQYAPLDAAIMGVYLHGLAGDNALQQQSMESLIASDIIENIGAAFKMIKN